MTHTEILLFIICLMFAGGIGIAAFILNEILIDIREMKAMLEEH
jgi:hypothetical protein